MIYYAADVPFIFITIVTARKNTKAKNVYGFITHSYEVMPLAVDPCLFANPHKCRHVCNGQPTANFWPSVVGACGYMHIVMSIQFLATSNMPYGAQADAGAA